jgi:flagellar biosynthetic protein FliP
MTKIHPDVPATFRRAQLLRFTRHFLKMVVAMVIGMAVLGPLRALAVTHFGWSDLFDRPELHALAMAADMIITMSLWMRYRGHSWISIAEMAIAMVVPFVVLFVPLWAGALSGATLLAAGHLLMLPAMVIAMHYRRSEYT